MQKTWLQHYSTEMPAEIDPDRNGTVLTLFEQSIRRFDQSPAFSQNGSILTFSDLDRLSHDLAAYLQKTVGLGKGDCVAVSLPNLLQLPVTLFAVMRTGARITNVNPQYTAPELLHQLNDSGAKAIILSTHSTAVLSNIYKETQLESVIVTAESDLLSTENNAVDKGFFLEQAGLVVDFCSALESGRKLYFDPVEILSEDILLLQYTGGTTGRSKGAILTHRNIVANLLQFSAMYNPILEPGKEIIITALPLYHIFALTVNCLAFLWYGTHNVLISNPRNLTGLVGDWRQWPCTAITGVNTLFNGLLHTPDFRELDFSSLKLSIGGGAAVQRTVADQWVNLTGCPILVGYGLTETSPLVATTPYTDTEFTGSIGIPVPSTEISLRDEQGREVGVGEAGQLCVKGPQVMLGYWGQEQATKEAITADGFFQTGDIATVDEVGYFKIVDRKKDMILVSGFNVYPNEIEDVVGQCPGVLENGCIGIKDERSGEAVKVFAVSQPGYKLDVSAIREHCASYLTSYKVPKHIEIIDALPKSSVGKILRRELRRMAEEPE